MKLQFILFQVVVTPETHIIFLTNTSGKTLTQPYFSLIAWNYV